MATELIVSNIPFQGGLEDLGLVAADAVDGNEFSNDGNVLVVANNTDAGAQTVTVTSVRDPGFGRLEDLVLNIAAGDLAIAGPFIPSGWNQAGAKVGVTASDAAVLLGAVRYAPRQ